MKYKQYQKKRFSQRIYEWSTVAVIIGIIVLIFYSINPFVLNISFTPCIIHDVFHIYCPGCGGTRAIKALLEFDVKSAFLCNPFVVYLVGYFMYYYIGVTVSLITKCKVMLFRFQLWQIYLGIFIFIINCVIRNILAIYYGIDYLGDIAIYWSR